MAMTCDNDVRSIHPAQYSRELYEPIATMLPRGPGVLVDPMAGLGYGLAAIGEMVDREPFGVEIEAPYVAFGHPCVRLGDARTFDFPAELVAVVTSPPYPNGMTDNFRASDRSWRNTYVHRLREHIGHDYDLHPDNSAGMNARRSPGAYERFMAAQAEVWKSVFSAMAPGGVFVLNTKDPVLRGVAVNYTFTTVLALVEAGFVVTGQRNVPTPGLRHGANGDQRTSFETLTRFVKPTG